MSIRARFTIRDVDVQAISSFPILSEIPYFLRHHKRRLKSIHDIVAVVSNRKHYHPAYVQMNTFHTHRTAYAAIDALAAPLAEYFMQSEILPIVQPIPSRFIDIFQDVYPALNKVFKERGILIPKREWIYE